MYAVKSSISGQEERWAKVYGRAHGQSGFQKRAGRDQPLKELCQRVRADPCDDHPR